MKLANGGVVDANDALMNEDRVLIIPLQDVMQHAKLDEVQIKQEMAQAQSAEEGEAKSKAMNQRLLEAINSIHMGNFRQIFKNYDEQT